VVVYLFQDGALLLETQLGTLALHLHLGREPDPDPVLDEVAEQSKKAEVDSETD
jgi:hypothetical protein